MVHAMWVTQGYINANYELVDEMLDLAPGEIKTLAANSFKASFLSPEDKYGRFVGATLDCWPPPPSWLPSFLLEDRIGVLSLSSGAAIESRLSAKDGLWETGSSPDCGRMDV